MTYKALKQVRAISSSGKELHERSTGIMLVRLRRAVVVCAWFIACSCLLSGIEAQAQGGEAEVRRAAETAFAQLRAGDYGALYEALPAASQRRITRERFVEALNRSRGMYELERVDIGEVGVAGDAAALDTTIYARVRQPVQGEGKIDVRQYLVREAGRWRVITDDRTGVRRLLAANRTLARRFPARQPSVSIKRDGRWIELTPPAGSRAARGARRRG